MNGAAAADHETFDHARRVVDEGAALHVPAGAAPRLALARALKTRGDAAWSRDPAAVVRAAEALQALARATFDAAGGDVGDAEGEAGGAADAARAGGQLQALADWMAGIAALTRGGMSAAVEALDRAEARFRELGRAGDAAQTQVPKIMALSVLGRHDEAARCGDAAQRELLALGDVHAASRVSLNLGNLHRRRHELAPAIRRFREAGLLFARAGDHERSVMADIGSADALAAQGDTDEALRLFARAAMRAQRHALPVLEALVQDMRAMLDLARGHYREALAGLEASRRRYEALAMPQHLAVAEKQLADAYLELRLLPEALRLFEQAIERFDRLEMPVEKAWALAQRARTQSLLGLDAAAVTASLLQAGVLFAAQGVPAGEATVHLARAELALDAADAAADGRDAAAAAAASAAAAAEALAGRAAHIFAAAKLADGHARAELVRAHAMLVRGQADAARQLLQATLERAGGLQLLPVQVRALTVLGLADAARGDDAAARRHFDAAIDLFEVQRGSLPGDELRSAFQANHLRPYRERLRMALAEAARDPSSPPAAAGVLHALERFRARALDERLARTAGADADADADAGPAQADAAGAALRTHLNWLHRLLQRAQDDGDVAPAPLLAALRRGEHALLEHTRRDRFADASRTDAAAAGLGDGGWHVAALQQALDEDAALVEYGVHGDELFACVVTRRGVRIERRLAAWPQVLDALRAARFQIDALRHGAAALQAHLPSLTRRAQARLQALHTLLWQPLAAALAGKSRVLVVPHAQLASLPFAALHDGARCLVERLTLAQAPSARVAWRGLLRPALAPRSIVALGETTHLVHAEGEARFVAGLFERAELLVGADAGLDGLARVAGAADLVHLASHAQFRADNPMFSALQLADGPLTVERVESLRLRPGIVTLSACETGLAEHGGGDESVGLVRAFLVAGAARVVASLWPVDDAVTAQFMAAFYPALRRGQAPAAALGAAQRALMRTHPHPFHWAAFTLHGGW